MDDKEPLMKKITLEEVQSEKHFVTVYNELVEAILDRQRVIELTSRVLRTKQCALLVQIPKEKVSSSDFNYIYFNMRSEKLRGQTIKEFLGDVFEPEALSDLFRWNWDEIKKDGTFSYHECDTIAYAIVLRHTEQFSCIVQ